MPAEAVFHAQISADPKTRWASYPAVIEQLKTKARALGLWNLFLSKAHYPDVGVELTNLEYALMAEIMGRCRSVAAASRSGRERHADNPLLFLQGGARGVQLLCARHGQHGGSGQIRHAGAEG